MAVTPEQRDTTAKTNLAELYFKHLIDPSKMNLFLRQRCLGDPEEIEETIHFALGIRPFTALKETLDLDKPSWQLAGANEMSSIILGGNFGEEEKAGLNQALVTIELTRHIVKYPFS